MANADFIVIRNSVEQAAWVALSALEKVDPAKFQGKKFKVIVGGWKPTLSKRIGIEETIGGRLDVSVGHIWKSADYTIRARKSLNSGDDTAYGTTVSLETYYKLNNPMATPSNKIYLVDHVNSGTDDKSASEGVLVGDHVPEPLTYVVEGGDAHFLIKIQFKELTAVGV